MLGGNSILKKTFGVQRKECRTDAGKGYVRHCISAVCINTIIIARHWMCFCINNEEFHSVGLEWGSRLLFL